jgi:hypothetical protein
MTSDRDQLPEIPETLRRAFPPSPDDLLLAASSRVTDDMLVEISEADYGMNAEENLAQLRLIRDHQKIAAPMGWEPKEVLELIRWSEPSDPGRKPGRTGERGHIMRAFACAALLRAAAEPANCVYFEGEDATLARLIDSALYMGKDLSEAAARFLTWRIPQLDSDQDRPFFAFGLLCVGMAATGPSTDPAVLAEAAKWVEAEESAQRAALGELLAAHGKDWLTGLVWHTQKGETWTAIARSIHSLAAGIRDVDTRQRIQGIAARVTAA